MEAVDSRPSNLVERQTPEVDRDPPGGILVWMIVCLELLTFGAGLGVFLFQSRSNLDAYQAGRELLNQPLALANTLILLSGGWCMVNGLNALREGKIPSSTRWIVASIATGVAFLVLKSFEYSEKFQHGIGFGDDTFFTLYFMLTGFHMAHVLVAVVILLFLAIKIRNGSYSSDEHLDVESGAVFWHMCDLIWLLIFPVIYLL